MIGRLGVTLGAGLVWAGTATVGFAVEGELVGARLVVDDSRLTHGGFLLVGVLFEVEPGWHIYWKNPGDSGLATDVRLGLPEGFIVGELRWPVPITFVQPGKLVGYGYEGTVALAAEVVAPEVERLEAAPVTASVSWLACREVCVLGSADLESSLGQAADSAAFVGWRDSLPRSDSPFEVAVHGALRPGERRGRMSLWIEWRQPPGQVDFFPDASARLKVSGVRVQTRGNLTRIDLDAAVMGGDGPRPEGLTAVITTLGGALGHGGWRLEAPLWDMEEEGGG